MTAVQALALLVAHVYACHWTEHAGGTREVTGMVERDVGATSPEAAVSQIQKSCETRKATCSAYSCTLKK